MELRATLLVLSPAAALVLAFSDRSSATEVAGGRGGGAACASQNGDVNADGKLDISDGITILGHIFLGEPAQLPRLCAPPAGLPGLPDTGQTICHDDQGAPIDCASDTCAGQDAFNATGCPPEGRFVDNGDGTLTDTCTGLMWEKDAGNGGNDLAWCAALAYCDGLELAGYEDWRLPSIRELHSIVDYGRLEPSLDPLFTSPLYFYFSSTFGKTHRTALTINFASGSSGVVMTYQAKVRAVRGGTKCGAENGDINADGALDISDGVTILGRIFLGDPTELMPLCVTSGMPFGLPETSHTGCRNESGAAISCTNEACPGQDGLLATGCLPEDRFLDNEDETITDSCTGLMWQKVTANHGEGLDWCSALLYCKELELAGHDDWRLPDIRELESLVDYGDSFPSINGLFGASSNPYVSSTSLADNPTAVWTVNFAAGQLSYESKFSQHLVRAVRGGSY